MYECCCECIHCNGTTTSTKPKATAAIHQPVTATRPHQHTHSTTAPAATCQPVTATRSHSTRHTQAQAAATQQHPTASPVHRISPWRCSRPPHQAGSGCLASQLTGWQWGHTPSACTSCSAAPTHTGGRTCVCVVGWGWGWGGGQQGGATPVNGIA